MIVSLRRVFLVALLLIVAAAPASAKDVGELYYLQPGQVDLTVLLAPPPDQSSALYLADQKKIADVLANRTPADMAQAKLDEHRSVFVIGTVLGPSFVLENEPLAAALFKHANGDTEYLIGVAKAYFGRPRPAGVPQTHGSYPSGHAAFAACTAILLSQMVPEKRNEIFARATIFAQSRIIAGVHYPSDVQAGWISGSIVAEALMLQPKFQADFAAAKVEVRRTLGLP